MTDITAAIDTAAIETSEKAECTITSIALYLVSRIYGGPQEGGWWFDAGYPVLMAEHPALLPRFIHSMDEDAIHSALNDMKAVLNASGLNNGRRPLGSVLATNIYQIRESDGLPTAFPAVTPIYE